MYKFCAILEGSYEIMWFYTRAAMQESVKFASYRGRWHMFELHEISQ